MTAITALQVKSSIARPAVGDLVPAGSTQRVFGAAWTGDGKITRVEVSTDGGASWTAANLIDRDAPFAWRLWDYHWKAPARAGRAVLMSRATDSGGRTQPMKRDIDRRTYVINHVLPVEVEVK